MKVLKFGGTSVGSIDSILKVKQIVESQKEPVIVVVSALGGVTDQLIKVSNMAVAGGDDYLTLLGDLICRHETMIKAVIPTSEAQNRIWKQVKSLLDELANILRGVSLLQDLSPKTTDIILSYGERISSIIVAELVGAKHYDARNFIKTEVKHNKRGLAKKDTEQLVREAFHGAPDCCLVPGFISTDKESGVITNIGRGGSDYTAAIIAAALDADSLEIWLYDRRSKGNFRCLSY